ncbi:DUF2380 domain-containing protein (plasmid) [Paroceanicella profunda]|uniref:DUF2380 domain-containing protein n=1 Tax=Paroceanicella profunda TaxID=2579971 RepID=A0A5B8FZL4_9RHOB|nr:DUF3280 domain-containing protein [Paroceanicella profunda]QDL93905.1 DUF2380 domain-containing protein [Paroceanicella profunda]
MKALAAALVLALALTALAGPPAGAGPGAGLREGARVAFFGVHFIDTSQEGALNGVRADETARLRASEAQVTEALHAHGFETVPLAPVQAELDRVVNPADCNGCALRMAQRLGADYAMVSEVQKVSNLILSMNIVVLDAATGAKVRGISADIRGNTDESWRRGFSYILRNNIFRKGED